VYLIAAGEDNGLPGFGLEAYLGLYTTTAWRIYDLNQDTAIDVHVIHDTMTWYNAGETLESAVDGLPPAIDAIRSAAYNVGILYGNRISPGWFKTQRYYHTCGGSLMRLAARDAAEDKWQLAAERWKIIAAGDKLRPAAHACFNLALVCEMEDDVITALDWAIKSYTLRQETLTREYIDLLRQRYEDRKKLKKQVPGGSD
jgi:hypothetical protein